jgi:hypothetical protein
MLKRLRQWWNKPKPKMHSGKCDRCDKPFIIWLDGSGLYCWDHYVETWAEFRFGEDRYGKGS